VLPGDFGLNFTHGQPGAGEVRLANGANRKHTRSYMPTLSFRHDGPLWKADAGLGYSYVINKYTDTQDGFFNGLNLRRTGVTVSFDDIFYLRPRSITVRDAATGAVVNPDLISSYALNSTTSTNRTASEGRRSAFANLGREFDIRGVPLGLKTGFDLAQQTRDIRTIDRSFTYVGADGRATTTPTDPLGSDGSAVPIFDDSFFGRYLPYGFGQVQWPSYEKAYSLFRTNPSHFTTNANNNYRSGVTGSKFAEEVVSSAYVRADLSWFQRRLKVVTGVRGEQTNIKAQGPLTDPTRNYQRDARGAVVLVNGNPVPIVPASDALGVSERTFIDRGQNTKKEYLRVFPSLNVGYNLRENLIVRGAYYESIGRPDFNQYAGGLTLPDTERPASQTNRITVNNAGIKAWTARTYKLRMEYYFEPIGQFTVSAFRRDYRNFFATAAAPATPEFLDLFGLDAATYGAYEVQTQRNLSSTVRTTGMDFDYKQVLSFLPRWARGVQVFANASTARATGPDAANFLGYIPRSGSLGISLTREKFNLRANWNFRSRARRNEITGRGIEPSTFEWRNSRSLMDLQGDYNLSKRFALFFNLRNVGDVPEDVERLGPNTPAVAQLRQRENWGALWTFGVKGSY
jgi:TonB-dependent receptor